MIDDKAKVSLTKVTVNSSPQDLSSSGFILVREASLTINSGNYVSKDYGFVNCSRGTFTVKGGTFSECAFNRYGFRPDKSKLLITGGRFSAGNDQYNQKYGIIRNGSFSDVTIKGGTLTNPNGPVIEKRSDENLRIYNAVLRIPGGTITEKQEYDFPIMKRTKSDRAVKCQINDAAGDRVMFLQSHCGSLPVSYRKSHIPQRFCLSSAKP